jgi:hypothetical protein
MYTCNFVQIRLVFHFCGSLIRLDVNYPPVRPVKADWRAKRDCAADVVFNSGKNSRGGGPLDGGERGGAPKGKCVGKSIVQSVTPPPRAPPPPATGTSSPPDAMQHPIAISVQSPYRLVPRFSQVSAAIAASTFLRKSFPSAAIIISSNPSSSIKVAQTAFILFSTFPDSRPVLAASG